MTDKAESARPRPAAWRAWFSRTIGFPLIVNGRWRRDKDRGRFLAQVEAKLAGQYWPLERQQAVQFERLKRLVEHAGQQVPYYRDLFRSLGFDPRAMRSPADLQQLPLLTRAIVQTEGPRLLADDAAGRGAYSSSTSGSTGQPMTYWHDAHYRDHAEAAAWMSDLTMGWHPGARLGLLWGASHDLRFYGGWRGLVYRILRNQHVYNAHDVSRSQLLRYHRAMQAAPPDILVAYASTAVLLANLLEANGLRPDYPRVALISSAETLDDGMRAVLERVFGPRVFNRYASREAGLLAYECPAHQGLHLNLSDHYLECLRPNAPRPAGPGEVIVTLLNNYCMPLIRYQIDDLAVMSGAGCACGRAAPLIARVVGRSGPTFTSASGQMVHGYYFSTPIRSVPGILQFQFVQEDLRQFRLLVVPGPDLVMEDFEPIRALVLGAMGADATLTVDLVHRIPPLPSGKANLLLSRLPVPLAGPAAD